MACSKLSFSRPADICALNENEKERKMTNGQPVRDQNSPFRLFVLVSLALREKERKSHHEPLLLEQYFVNV